jgi:hypothetical protein
LSVSLLCVFVRRFEWAGSALMQDETLALQVCRRWCGPVAAWRASDAENAHQLDADHLNALPLALASAREQMITVHGRAPGDGAWGLYDTVAAVGRRCASGGGQR